MGLGGHEHFKSRENPENGKEKLANTTCFLVYLSSPDDVMILCTGYLSLCLLYFEIIRGAWCETSPVEYFL